MTSLLLQHGVLHCVSHPFATAMLVDGSVITWIGDDDTARTLGSRADRTVDLDGALVAPRFVDMPTAEALDVRGGAPAVREALDTLHRRASHGHLPGDEAAVDRGLRRRRLSFLVDGAVPADVFDRLVRWGVTMLVDLAGPDHADVPLASLARAGVPYVLLPTVGDSPWETTRRAVHGLPPEHRVSARAAFRAQTRAAWRLSGDDLAGEIRIGQRAELSVWRAESVGVEDATTGIATWSTDARSGTPLLPVLGPEGPLPVRELDVVSADVVSTFA